MTLARSLKESRNAQNLFIKLKWIKTPKGVNFIFFSKGNVLLKKLDFL